MSVVSADGHLAQVPPPVGVAPAVTRVEVPRRNFEATGVVGNPHTHQLRHSKSADEKSTLRRIAREHNHAAGAVANGLTDRRRAAARSGRCAFAPGEEFLSKQSVPATLALVDSVFAGAQAWKPHLEAEGAALKVSCGGREVAASLLARRGDERHKVQGSCGDTKERSQFATRAG